MLIAAFEPGKEIAIANFFLAIFCLFTIVLPLLLITRGDKTKANRDFLKAMINPWSKIAQEPNLTQVVFSEISSSVKIESNMDELSEQEKIFDSEEVISLEININEKKVDSNQSLKIDDELLAA